MKTFLRFTMLALAFLAPAAVFAAQVKVVGEWTSKASGYKLEAAVYALEGDAIVGNGFDLAKSRADTNPGCFTLLRHKDGKLEKLPIKIVKASARQIILSTLEPIDEKAKHTLIIEKGCLTLNAAHTAVNPYEGVELEMMGDVDVIKRPFDGSNLTNFEIKQGEKTGAFSVKFVYIRNWRGDKAKGPEDVEDEPEANFHLNLEADGVVRPKERNAYMNKLELEMGGYMRTLALGSLTDVGFSTKLQADQEFTTIDQTFGVNAWTWANWGWLNKVSDALYLGTASARPDWQNHPLFIVGYDYVAHYQTDGDEDEDYTGNHRVNARLYWPIPIARGLTLPVFNTKFGIDAVIDAGANWDIINSSVAPVVKSSLEFPIGDGEDVPRITFSYVNGRVAPKFEEFDAFLAGFKVPWGIGSGN